MRSKMILASVMTLTMLSCFIALAYAQTATSATLVISGSSGGPLQTSFAPGATVYVAWQASPSGSTVDLKVEDLSNPGTYIYDQVAFEADSGEISFVPPHDGFYEVTITGTNPVNPVVTKVIASGTFEQVIPEIPLIGTAGASIAMLGGLAYKMKRKKA